MRAGLPLALAAFAGLAAAALSPPAEARRRPRARHAAAPAEEDPRLGGGAKAFAKARAAFVAPADLSVLDASPEGVEVELAVEGYAIGPGPAHAYALLIVDNDVALRIDAGHAPLLLRGLPPGPHALRAVLSRPWGEVVKAEGAFALTRFWLGPRLEGKAGAAAEAAVWPNPKKPILTYVFPLGDPVASDPTLSPFAPAGPAAPVEPEPAPDAGDASDAGAPPETHSAKAEAHARKPAGAPRLDFYLSGATLRRRGRGDKLRIVVDKKELPLIREWKPLPLKLHAGEHRITIDLLDRRGTKVRNAVNRTDRTFTVEEH